MKKSILTLVITVFMTTLGFANSEVYKNELEAKQQPKIEQKEDKTKNNRIYTWEVKTESGFVKGTSISLEDAKQMIALISTDEMSFSKVIISKEQNN